MINIEKICVLGAGNMGHQISLCAALSGYKVKCFDVKQEVLHKADEFVDNYLKERVNKGKLSQQAALSARENTVFTEDFVAAAADADLVIEAALENLDLKRDIFTRLDSICQPHTILATNSSYIVSSKIADATRRSEKVCNMHFFNPALVMKLVEVVKGPHTSEETAETVKLVAEKMNKIPVVLRNEIYGFLVNRINTAIRNEAMYLADQGIASPQDIDTAVVNGLGYPMGPFQMLDLVGIDLVYEITMARYRDSRDITHRPSPYLVEKYVKGEWGRKTGKGFYEYSKDK